MKQLPNFNLIASVSSLSSAKGGTLLFAKPGIDIEVITTKCVEQNNSHLDLIVTKTLDHLMLFLYCSPTFPTKLLITEIEQYIHNRKDYLIMGDFNIDFFKLPNIFCVFLSKHEATFLIEEYTTNYFTCIDNYCILHKSTKGNKIGIVYENLNSDHRPFYIVKRIDKKLESNNINEKKNEKSAIYNKNKQLNATIMKQQHSDDIKKDVKKEKNKKDAEKEREHVKPKVKTNINEKNIMLQLPYSIFEVTNEGMLKILESFYIKIEHQYFGVNKSKEEYYFNDNLSILHPDVSVKLMILSYENVLNQYILELRNIEPQYFHNEIKCADSCYTNHLLSCLLKAYKFCSTPGDGNCFYNATSILLCGNLSLKHTLRLIMLYLYFKFEENLSNILFENDEFKNEIRSCALNDILCKKYNVNVLDCWNNNSAPLLFSYITDRPLITILEHKQLNYKKTTKEKSYKYFHDFLTKQSPIYSYPALSYNRNIITKKPYILSLSLNHWTAVVKQEENEPCLPVLPIYVDILDC